MRPDFYDVFTTKRAPDAPHNRWVASLDELTDEEVLRREADTCRTHAESEMAERLDAIADHLAGLRQLINHP